VPTCLRGQMVPRRLSGLCLPEHTRSYLGLQRSLSLSRSLCLSLSLSLSRSRSRSLPTTLSTAPVSSFDLVNIILLPFLVGLPNATRIYRKSGLTDTYPSTKVKLSVFCEFRTADTELKDSHQIIASTNYTINLNGSKNIQLSLFINVFFPFFSFYIFFPGILYTRRQ